MFKTTLIASTAVMANAISGDFMSGLKTGLTVHSEKDFDDFDCEVPEINAAS